MSIVARPDSRGRLSPTFVNSVNFESLGGSRFGLRCYCSQREPIRTHPVPLLDHHSVGFEELTNANALPAGNILENWRQHSQRAGAKNSPLGDLRNVLGLGDRDRVSITHVRMQHDVYVGAAVADVNNVVGADLRAGLQLIENEYFSIACSCASDRLDLAVVFI